MYEDLIPRLATATRITCLKLTPQQVISIADSIEQATRFPGSHGRNTASPEVFSLLAEAVDDPSIAGALRLGTGMVHDLARLVGPTADRMTCVSSRRLIGHLRARDADAAEREIEKYLRCLHFFWRLARYSNHPSWSSPAGRL